MIEQYAIIESDSKIAVAYAAVIEWASAQFELAICGSRKSQRRYLAHVGTRGRRGARRVKAL